MAPLGLGALARRWPLKFASNKMWPRACILAYHRVAAPAYDPFGQCVTPTNFAQHLRVLRQKYSVMALAEFVERLPYGDYADGTVAVTFDDGYVDNYTVAYPLAADFEIPLTVFISVRPVVDGKAFWWDRLAASLLDTSEETLSLTIRGENYGFTHHTPAERCANAGAIQRLLLALDEDERELTLAQLGESRTGQTMLGDARPLTVDELLQMAKLPAVQIGAHTLSHPRLSILSEDQQRMELQQSRWQLMELTGKAVTLMSYPFGKSTDLSAVTSALAAKAHYCAAFMTTPCAVMPGMDLFTLPRLTVHDWSVGEFTQRLEAIFG